MSIGLASSMLRRGNSVVLEYRTNVDAVVNSGVPVLILHAQNDKVTSVSGSQALVEASRNDNVKLECVPDSNHEMHNELLQNGRAIFYDKLTHFIRNVFDN